MRRIAAVCVPLPSINSGKWRGVGWGWGVGGFSATQKIQKTSCTFPFLLLLSWFLSPAATLSDLLSGWCSHSSDEPDFGVNRAPSVKTPSVILPPFPLCSHCLPSLVLSTDGKCPADALAADQGTRWLYEQGTSVSPSVSSLSTILFPGLCPVGMPAHINTLHSKGSPPPHRLHSKACLSLERLNWSRRSFPHTFLPKTP